MIMLAYIHGLRVSELLSLRLSDFELATRHISISRMKNGFSTIHPLLFEEVMAIKQWLVVRNTIVARSGELDEDRLFISCTGRALSRQQFYNILSAASERAALSVPAHPHMLRHACGYALADNGIDTRLIQDYLGHRNIRHTVIYTASNSARFAKIWGDRRKEKKQLFGLFCKS